MVMGIYGDLFRQAGDHRQKTGGCRLSDSEKCTRAKAPILTDSLHSNLKSLFDD
ncbi:hypothetical protein [Amycolatopsis thailandensis]|uniref:hypothetical protein n=1 Tax=Amycolatopsis thailandensis TaxID=589330 RepID=UPI003644C09D